MWRWWRSGLYRRVSNKGFTLLAEHTHRASPLELHQQAEFESMSRTREPAVANAAKTLDRESTGSVKYEGSALTPAERI
jgi:hypothetical protein